MISFFKPAPIAPALPAGRIDAEYRWLRWQVFAGIFFGYAGFYLVRGNFSLALPEILKAHPEYSKAQLGGAMTGLAMAYGISKFVMGSVSDRSNPRWFMATGLLLSSAITFAFGVVPALYGSLFLVIALQALNGWCNGMGWPPCGKTMVHWWSTRERGQVVAVWNCAHNVGGALIAVFGTWAMAHFGDWGAKFWFNAAVAAARLGRPLLPTLRITAHPLHHPLNLPGRDWDAAGLLQVTLGFEIGALIGPFQTKEFGQGWGIAHIQSQSSVGGKVTLFFSFVIIVVAANRKGSENSLHLNGFPAFAQFSRFGLIDGVNSVGGLLQQPAHQLIA